jgi:hypothetical protein
MRFSKLKDFISVLSVWESSKESWLILDKLFLKENSLFALL